MKKLLIIAVFTAITFASTAQNRGFRVGGGVSVDIPVSNLNGASIGVGIDLLGQYGISDNIAITGDAGYHVLFAKEDNVDALGIIPIRAGIRFFPSATNLYLGGKVGVGIFTGNGSGSSTAYSFGAGYKMDEKLDIGLSYDGYSNNGSIGLIAIRLGYFFN